MVVIVILDGFLASLSGRMTVRLINAWVACTDFWVNDYVVFGLLNVLVLYCLELLLVVQVHGCLIIGFSAFPIIFRCRA